eukprot:gb/GECH01012956.1/.p1 GENE.gb/GECH01012956.1/~~gb/GECH01012956.1/.p1  ORF type:complete len:351 (+),score=95.80 gb/GECH01012956.1/:1-1053(+)
MPSTRIISSSHVEQVLTMRACIDAFEKAFPRLHDQDSWNPLRSIHKTGESDKNVPRYMVLMPSSVPSFGFTGLKALTIYPDNHGTNLPSHQGVVLLYNVHNGSVRAIIEGSSLTGIRTAAASGVATQQLARQDASSLAVLGSGVQARSHIEAMIAARPSIRKIRVWSRTQANAEKLVQEFKETPEQVIRATKLADLPFLKDIDISAAETVHDACSDADIICTVTGAKEPILFRKDIKPGTHINAVGVHQPDLRELASDIVCSARLFTDSMESAMKEAGDYLIPISRGELKKEDIKGEIGSVITGELKARENKDQDITIFKSLGVGMEDVVASHIVLEKSEEQGLGTEVEL